MASLLSVPSILLVFDCFSEDSSFVSVLLLLDLQAVNAIITTEAQIRHKAVNKRFDILLLIITSHR